MVHGKVTSSSYFWITAIFSAMAILQIVSMAAKIHNQHQLVLLFAPSLVGVSLITLVAGIGAYRALQKAKADQTAERKAFEKFRTYSISVALITIALLLARAIGYFG